MKFKLSDFRSIIKTLAKNKTINDFTNGEADKLLEKAKSVVEPYKAIISRKKGIKASIEGALATGVAVATINYLKPFLPVDEPETANAISILIGVIVGALFNGVQKFFLNWKKNKSN